MKPQKITAKRNMEPESRLDAKQRAGCLFLEKSSCLSLSNAELVLFLFQLMYQQILDTNDILRKSDVESSRQDQTQLDSASESKKMRQPHASDAERLCLAMSDTNIRVSSVLFTFIYFLICLFFMRSGF